MASRKPKYRLQIVLDQKEEAKKEAAIFLSEARNVLRQEREREEELRVELKKNQEKREMEYNALTVEGLSTGFDAGSAQNRLHYIKRLDTISDTLKEKIQKQNERVVQAEKEVEEALQNLIAASRELQVMEKHKERWAKALKQEFERKEQNEMNEIGNVMYAANAGRE